MKNLRIGSIAALLIVCLFLESWSPGPVAGKKWALIVAVGDYPRTGGWMDLSSGRDADVLAASLQSLQFDEILLLKDADASRVGIINAFENQIISRITPGDVVFFHFSGHGQQISEELSPPSLTKDELDGLDEALVPVDARDNFQYGVYEGQNHLTDDQLRDLLVRARQKLGPNGQMVLSVDACYSGTINRDAGLVRSRGTKKVFSPSEIKSTNPEKRGGGLVEASVSVEGSGLAPLVVISASRADEPNYETVDQTGQSIGSLSYALSRTFSRLKPNQSFEAFFRQLKYEMKQLAPNQTPQIEGDVTQEVFGSANLPLLGLQILRFDNPSTPVLQAGTLADLHPNSEILLQPLGSGQPIRGKVTASSLTESTVALQQPVNDPNPGNWKVVVDRKVALAAPVRIFSQVADPNLANVINQGLAREGNAQVVQNNAELLIVQQSPGAPLQLLNAIQQPIQQWQAQGQDPNYLARQLKSRIEQYARAQYLRNLSASSDIVTGLELQVIPVRVEQTASNQIRIAGQENPLAAPVVDYPSLPVGTYFIYKVVNNTQSQLYFSVVGVSSDDATFILVPDMKASPNEFRINPGQEIVLARGEYIFQSAEPRGLDTYLVIGSTAEMDLRPVFNDPGGTYRGGSENEKFRDMLFGGTRGGFVNPGQLAVGSVTVRIE